MKKSDLVMSKIIEILGSDIAVGWIVPIILFVLSSDKMMKKYKQRKKIKTYKSKVNKNIFKEYCENKKVQKAVSFGDQNAIKGEMVLEAGNRTLKAQVDMKNSPNNNEKRDFVMLYLQYLSNVDLSGAYLNDYKIEFEIKASDSIKAIQLEINNNNMDKLVDEFIKTSNIFEKYSLKMKNYCTENLWENIKEICFTVFAEEEYITETKGTFEIKNFQLVNKES